MASSLHLGNQPNLIRRPPGPSRSGSPASRPPSVLPSRSRPCAGHADLVPQTPQSEVWFQGSGQEADSPPSCFPRCTHSVRIVTRMPSCHRIPRRGQPWFTVAALSTPLCPRLPSLPSEALSPSLANTASATRLYTYFIVSSRRVTETCEGRSLCALRCPFSGTWDSVCHQWGLDGYLLSKSSQFWQQNRTGNQLAYFEVLRLFLIGRPLSAKDLTPTKDALHENVCL